jgi:phosphate transport system substrate-binding protein
MRKYAIAAATALVATAVLAGPSAYAAETISSGGASTQTVLQAVCTAAYTTDKVTYVASSSGTGRTNFLNGTFDFGGTDVAYGDADAKPASFTYVPVVGVPVGIIFNVEGVKSLNLTAKVLGGILNGRYTTWDDAEIKKLNPSANLPSTKINTIYRTSSGTMQNLARFLAGNGASGYKDSSAWTTASGQASPIGVSAGSAPLMVAAVKATANSIGYADLSDAATAGLPFAAIRNPLGAFVKPSVAASAKFLAAQRVLANGILDIDYKASIAGGYNLSLVSYVVAPTASTNVAKGTAVRNYVSYLVNKCGPAKAATNNYVPLSGALLVKAKALVAQIK